MNLGVRQVDAVWLIQSVVDAAGLMQVVDAVLRLMQLGLIQVVDSALKVDAVGLIQVVDAAPKLIQLG